MRFHLRPLGVCQYQTNHRKLASQSSFQWNPESQQTLVKRLDRDDPEWARHPIVLGHRDVPADREGVFAEPKDRFLAVDATRPRKGPLAAAMMDQRAVLVGRASPEAPDAAARLVLRPALDIELSLSIERSRELVAAAGMSFGKLWRAGQFQADAL